MTDNKISLKLKVIYATTFAACACYFPFLTYYFQQRGLNFTQIGVIYAASSTMAIIAPPIWGIITDKHLNKRTTLIITMVVSSVLAYNFVLARNFVYIIISVILFQSFLSSIAPVVDALNYEIIDKKKNIQYGRIRLVGSICYAFSALFCGQIIKHLGSNSAFVVYSIIMLIGVIFVYRIDFKGKESRGKVNLSDFVYLLGDKRFFVFLISVMLAGICLGSDGAYISVLIQKTGGKVTQLGIFGFIVALSEIPSLFYGSKLLKKFGELNLLMLGLIFYALRYFLDSVSISYVSVLIIQSMQGVSYTLLLMSAYQYINKIAPAKLRTSSMTFYTATLGTGGLIGNLCGGILLGKISIFMLYKLIASICIVALLVVVMLKRINTSGRASLEGEINVSERV